MPLKNVKKMENKITIEFIPYHTFKNFNREEKIKKIIEKVKDEKLLLIEGILEDAEKKELIMKSMEEFNFKFKGIEIETIPYQANSFFDKIKLSFLRMLYKNRVGLTIIGPASIVKEIKKDPNHLRIYMSS